MGEIVPIVTQQAAEGAWTAYQQQVQRLTDRPALIFDRGFMQELWRRERLAKRLFGRLDA